MEKDFAQVVWDNFSQGEKFSFRWRGPKKGSTTTIFIK